MTEDSPEDDGGRTDTREQAASPAAVDELAAEYREAGRPFARVTVVRREPPVSATVGDRAVVTAEGDLTGWIGGAACAQSVVVDEATAAIDRGEPSLIGLAPDPDAVDRPGLTAYPMTCHSGGTLELFVEPVLPTPRLVVIGDSPIARALTELAGETSFEVSLVRDVAGDRPAGEDVGPTIDASSEVTEVVPVTETEAVSDAVAGAFAVVVASMGEYDEVGLEAALRADVPYVGLVASDARRDELADIVADRMGEERERIVRAITAPAGLDIGAETPEEIAVSIVAELVDVRRSESEVPLPDVDTQVEGSGGPEESETVTDEPETETEEPETVTDPVCGMTVEIAEAAATVTHDGDTYHFCGEGCAEAFEADPDRYRDPDRDEGVVTGA